MSEQLREAITPEFFMQTGNVSREVAAELAAQHNQLANLKAPAPPPPSTFAETLVEPRAPTTPRAIAAVEKRAAQLVEWGTDAKTARSVAAQEYALDSGTAVEKAALFNQMENAYADGQITAAFDSDMEPPPNPDHYNFPSDPMVDMPPEGLAFEQQCRQALFSAGFPVRLGNAMAERVAETARTLGADPSPERIAAYTMGEDQALRDMWGGRYSARLAMVEGFLRGQAEHSPELKDLLVNHPLIFSSRFAVETIARVAESYQRTRK